TGQTLLTTDLPANVVGTKLDLISRGTRDWTATNHVSGTEVNLYNRVWRAKENTTAGDEPGISTKWELKTGYDMQRTKNLFNIHSLKVGYRLNTADANYSTSDFIEVEENTAYVQSNEGDILGKYEWFF